MYVTFIQTEQELGIDGYFILVRMTNENKSC
jgi:hypothetical protein